MKKNTLPPDQLELYKRLDEIIYYKWDPIGVSEMDWARDEYKNYVPRFFSLVLENTTPEPIAKFLTVISTENMGLSPKKDHDLKIAILALKIKDYCLEYKI